MPRDIVLPARFTTAEAVRLEAEAAMRGTTVSSLIRRRALAPPFDPAPAAAPAGGECHDTTAGYREEQR